MLYGIIGEKGSGKTLLLVKLIKDLKDNDKKIKVFTNFHLNNIEYEIIDFSKLLNQDTKMDNAIVGIDEIYLFADCRMSASNFNRSISYLMYQTRKRNTTVLYTGVSYNTIDIRLRRATDGIFFPHLYVNDKKVNKPEKITRKMMEEIMRRKYKVEIKGLFYTRNDVEKFTIHNPTKYFDYYSSYELIEPVYNQKTKLKNENYNLSEFVK